MNEVGTEGPGLSHSPLAVGHQPPVRRCLVLLDSQLEGDISTWGKMIWKDGAESKNGIETLKGLSRQHQQAVQNGEYLFQMH